MTGFGWVNNCPECGCKGSGTGTCDNSCCYCVWTDVILPCYTVFLGGILLLAELRLPFIHSRCKDSCGFMFSLTWRTRSNYIATIPPEPERTNTVNIRSSNVFTTLIKIKRNVKRVRKRINNHKSKKVAHLFGNRFDRRSISFVPQQNELRQRKQTIVWIFFVC